MIEICRDEAALAKMAVELASKIKAPALLFFQGDLGAGKTCFIRYFLQARGVTDRIKSPTYTLMEIYETPNAETIVHLDLYRFNDPREWYDLDVEAYLSTSIVCIEWPERAEILLPKPDLRCQLSIVPEGRLVEITLLTTTTTRHSRC